MTIRDRVAAFLRKRSPRAICDSCVGDHLSLTRQQVCRAACFLASLQGYERRKGNCSGCCSTHVVTAYA